MMSTILALDRFLDEHGLIWLERLDQHFGVLRADGAVEIDGDIDVVAPGFAQGGECFARLPRSNLGDAM